MPKKILFLATDGFEQSELEKPKASFEQAGFDAVVASPNDGEIRGFSNKEWGDPVKVDMTLDEVDVADFDALVLPGGQINPDSLRMEEGAIRIIRDFAEADKPIAAICHGPWLLVEAGIVDGRTMTSWPSLRTDLRNAGAEVVDKEVVIDGNIITSRNPDDIPAFSQAVIDALGQSSSSRKEAAMS